MIKFKYSDLSDGSTMAYKTFDRHYKSFEARRKQLEREEAIMLGLTAKMQELGEITYDEYNEDGWTIEVVRTYKCGCGQRFTGTSYYTCQDCCEPIEKSKNRG